MGKKKKPKKTSDGRKIVAQNRKARHDYFIVDTIEAGIALVGTEVKAVREGHVNITDAFAEIRNGEAWLVGMYIGPYSHATVFNHEPRRRRKLLLHKQEIKRLSRKIEEKGFTLVPLSVYFKRGLLKVELALVRGKRKYDKREEIKERDLKRALRKGDDFY